MSARRCHAFRAAGTIVLAALALLGQHQAHAQQVVLTPGSNLDFGSFVVTGAGTITLLPNGDRTSSGGVILLNSSPVHAGSVNVRRNNSGRDRGAIVTLPPNGGARLSSGAGSMVLNAINSNPPSLASLPTSNDTNLSIGATLVVAPKQPAGRYTGTFNVNVTLIQN